MELIERRASEFDQAIFWRNVREYAASMFVAVVFALLSIYARGPLTRLGYGMVSVAAVWVILFLWLMQRSARGPLPESDGESYRHALLARYDRQILLNRTAWAWYVLPFTVGLVVSSLGHAHPPGFGYVMAGFMLAVGLAIAILNWKVASGLAAEKRELAALLAQTE
jgi:hypothetical protein